MRRGLIRRDRIRGTIKHWFSNCPNCHTHTVRRLHTDSHSGHTVWCYYTSPGLGGEFSEYSPIIARKYKGEYVCYKCAKKLRLFKKPFDDAPEPLPDKVKIRLGIQSEVVA